MSEKPKILRMGDSIYTETWEHPAVSEAMRDAVALAPQLREIADYLIALDAAATAVGSGAPVVVKDPKQLSDLLRRSASILAGPIASEIARLTGERDAARETNRELHRRLQAVEGPLQAKLADAERAAAFWLKHRKRAGRDYAAWHRRATAAEAALSRLQAALSRLQADRDADAERFRALMRCGRIKPQGSAGVDPETGERRYPDRPGAVHFGAEFWVEPEIKPSNLTIWGRHCLRALADDILAFEARAALTETPDA